MHDKTAKHKRIRKVKLLLDFAPVQNVNFKAILEKYCKLSR